MCSIELLVCDNLLPPLQSTLGWDFLTFYSLQLAVVEGSLCLVGPHGCTPLTPWSPPAVAHPQLPSPQHGLPVFVQNSDYGPAYLTDERVKQEPLPRDSKVNLISLWHFRYGHLGYDNVKLLNTKSMVEGLNFNLKEEFNRNCEGCAMGKQNH